MSSDNGYASRDLTDRLARGSSLIEGSDRELVRRLERRAVEDWEAKDPDTRPDKETYVRTYVERVLLQRADWPNAVGGD